MATAVGGTHPTGMHFCLYECKNENKSLFSVIIFVTYYSFAFHSMKRLFAARLH